MISPLHTHVQRKDVQKSGPLHITPSTSHLTGSLLPAYHISRDSSFDFLASPHHHHRTNEKSPQDISQQRERNTETNLARDSILSQAENPTPDNNTVEGKQYIKRKQYV